MSKVDYWMNPKNVKCDTFRSNSELTLEVLAHCTKYINTCEVARKNLNDELKRLGFPGLDEMIETLIRKQSKKE
jgi:hypothetical protein